MALDSILIHKISSLLSNRLVGKRIDKIHQPDKLTLLISIDGSRLIASIDSDNSRLQLTHASCPVPDNPPMFCMLLRKYILGSTIEDIQQVESDRIVAIRLVKNDGFGSLKRYSLYFELTGLGSNIIFADAENVIIDCMLRRNFSEKTGRALQPGMIYRTLPKTKRTNILNATEQDILTLLNNTVQQESDILVNTFSGSQYLVLRYLEKCFYEKAYCSEGKSMISDFIGIIHDENCCYYCYNNNSGKNLITCYPLPENEYSLLLSSHDLFQLMDFSYNDSQVETLRRKMCGKLIKQVESKLESRQNKLVKLQHEYSLALDRDNILLEAELIKANLYQIKPGDDCLYCTDYITPETPMVTIKLDPTMSPSDYMASLYRKYRKKKTAEGVLSDEISKCSLEIEYLQSVIYELGRVEAYSDLEEIRNELTSSGFIRKESSKSKKAKKPDILSIKTENNTTIYIGRNNLQNDYLTFSFHNRNYLWFHVKNYHGSHVIMAYESFPDEAQIELAAEYAAFYSQCRNSGKIAVDYTYLKNVKKLPGGLPGRVTYTNYKTVVVSSENKPAQNLQ